MTGENHDEHMDSYNILVNKVFVWSLGLAIPAVFVVGLGSYVKLELLSSRVDALTKTVDSFAGDRYRAQQARADFAARDERLNALESNQRVLERLVYEKLSSGSIIGKTGPHQQ